MIQPIQILLVEDEMIIAATISLQLTEMGYEVSGIIPRGEDALHLIKKNLPDIVLIDIQLRGRLDGIDTARKMQELCPNLAIIYLTPNADQANFERAKDTKPYAFISKPFKRLDLQRTIESTVNQISCSIKIQDPDVKTENSTYILKDCLFIRHHESMIKLDIKAIRYIEAERNYSRIFCSEKEHLLVSSLKEMNKKLPQQHFLRIHRSYIINLSRIDEIAGTYVVIAKKAIPMTKAMRPELLKRLQTI
ncbi:LytR/AlgR family response regulator transcription factor [Salegentibacter sediminis]|uniref:LytR/AlgR family response regulator transcription factor n=1 Tax=Salegentibacter sediminis TaxID=1930251 RepID=UPI0009BECFCB|nr:response regulator [Salegentibacter sediminis]